MVKPGQFGPIIEFDNPATHLACTIKAGSPLQEAFWGLPPVERDRIMMEAMRTSIQAVDEALWGLIAGAEQRTPHVDAASPRIGPFPQNC